METRVALITGASSGIGRACATHVAALGVRVYDTSRAAPTGIRLQLNVTDDTSVQRAVDNILQHEGKLDIVVNNAGIAVAGPLELVNTRHPRLRYTAGPATQRAAVWLKRLLPRGLLRGYRLDRG